MRGKKGFLQLGVIPALIMIEVILVVVTFSIFIAFDISMYMQWNKFKDIEEASIKISTIANNLDTCIASGTDCGTCNHRMMDRNNAPFLFTSYQSPNFRFDIEGYKPGSSSCVINAVKVNADRIPEYSSKPYNQVSFTCAGRKIMPGRNLSGIDLCRDEVGNRSTYGFGALQSS